MNALRIFVDFTPSTEALILLKESAQGHELCFARSPITSILAQGEPDPQINSADIAFGQPEVTALLESPRLRWVHISSSGITRYDTAKFRAELTARKVILSNSSSVYEEACALQALAFILAGARCLPESLRARFANGTPEWSTLRGACRPLRGQRVLIVGYGAIARRLTTFLHPLGLEIMAYRRRVRGDESVPVITAASLSTELARADHIINILPESGETRGFFSAQLFAAFKRGALFYNIGRGATVQQEALLAALRSGQIVAAWLDVTTPEPLPEGHPLWLESNCFVTPHIAGGHTAEEMSLVRHFTANLARFIDGKALVDQVT